MHCRTISSWSAIHLLLAAMAVGFIADAPPAWAEVIYEDLKLLAGDGAAGDRFGQSVAVSGGILAVGAPFDDDDGIDSGAAHLFNASTGAELLKLTPDDGAAGDQFGHSIAMADGIVAVGARLADDNGSDAGAAYLFNASTGAQIAKLLPEDGAAGDEFGNSIAIDNGIVAVGAWRDDDLGDGSGAAYLFDASTGDQLDKLLPDTGNDYQTFGVSIAMDDGIVVIGARTFFVLGEGFTFAKAYLFDVSTGNQINVLQADIENYNGDRGGHFGDAVDIDNGIVAVGAWGRSIFYDHSGAAYLFDAATGSQLAFIFPDDGHDRDNFGISIAIDNGIVAIGAHNDGDSGWQSGSAYLYDASDATLVNKLLVIDGAQFDRFGTSVAVENGLVAGGAIGFGGSGTETGYVCVFGADVPTGVESSTSIVGRILLPASPNPFGSSTTLSYVLDAPGRVALDIISVSGRYVRSLVNEHLSTGTHNIDWDGRDAHGRELSAGVYFARFEFGGEVSYGRLVLSR